MTDGQRVLELMEATDRAGFDLTDMVCELYAAKGCVIMPDGQVWVEGGDADRFLSTDELAILFSHCDAVPKH